MRPKLLDLFCGAGGAGMGYQRAGFDVTGVDIAPQPRYPFAFAQSDALEYVAAHGHEFDAIHASPPCQGYSVTAHIPNRDMSSYPKLIEPVRAALRRTGRPYAIENVPGAPLRSPLMLCGTMFGLHTIRHRLFECRPTVFFAPASCNHHSRANTNTNGSRLAYYSRDASGMVTVAGHLFSLKAGSDALGIDWMTRAELAEAIPPAYTEYIGRHLLAAVLKRAS